MSENQIEIVLERLTGEEESFWNQAIKNFERNMPWNQFEEFAFGSQSVLYQYGLRYPGATPNLLYAALEAVWLKLGIRQGFISKDRDRIIVIRYGDETITIS